MALRGLGVKIRDIIKIPSNSVVVTSQLDAPRDEPRSFVRSRVGDPSAFGVGIPSALAHSLTRFAPRGILAAR